MKKTINILYWVTTGLLAVSFLYGGYSEIMRDDASIAVILHLGYPVYLLTLLGVAKILAVFGILQRFSPGLREWAYAGIIFDVVGALWSSVAVGDSFALYAPALVTIIITAISYITLHKREKMRMMPSAM